MFYSVRVTHTHTVAQVREDTFTMVTILPELDQANKDRKENYVP